MAKGMNKKAGCFGYEASMGIPKYDESIKEGLTPLKNRWSATHEVSMGEAMRMVRKGDKDSSSRMKDTD